MPELPEVETIRRQLEREAVGKRIKSVEVHGTRTVRRQPKKQLVTRLEGAKVTGVSRRGEYLLLSLDTGDVAVVHLSTSGQLLRAAAKDPLLKHTHVVVTFTQGGQLRFSDPKATGEVFVTNPETIDADFPELGRLGIDPVEEPMSWTQFGQLLHRHRMKLKAFLTDQTILAGIGDLYSDEILYAAGLRYDRMTDSLSTMEIRRLYRSVVETMHEAIKYSGSSLTVDQYVDLFGKTGTYQDHHQVHDRDKQACRRCRGVITKAKFQQRTTYFCESCQV